jgi:hypothetical protein
LPVPLSPVSRTVDTGRAATFARRDFTPRITGELPTRFPHGKDSGRGAGGTFAPLMLPL